MYYAPEPLESRIAPAVLVNALNPKTAIYTDVDGDTVTIIVSKGNLNDAVFVSAMSGDGEQLQAIQFGGGFAGANLTLKVIRASGGDGLAHVGAISATTDLGVVTLRGDLGQIDAGDGIHTTPGLKGLKVASMGEFGLTTQSAGLTPSLISNLEGSVGQISVAGNMDGASILVNDGAIGPVTLGGSLLGGTDPGTGVISAKNIGAVKIGGDLRGDGSSTGYIQVTGGKLASLTIGGSIIGSGASSGRVSASTIGAIVIGGDLEGDLANSGQIFGQEIKSITIGGSVIGRGSATGAIIANAKLGAVKIGGDITGGTGGNSGTILAAGSIASITIGGGVFGGPAMTATLSGRIAADSIGSLRIAGDLAGGGANGAGSVSVTTTLGSLFIGGDLRGSTGTLSGHVSVDGNTSKMEIRGSIVGGDAEKSGSIFSNSTGTATVFGDLDGANGSNSGSMSLGPTNTVKVGGALLGGASSFTGSIQTGSVNSISIGQDLRGGSGLSGSILVSGIANSIVIEGTMYGASGDDSGAVFANSTIKSILVKGSVRGGTGLGSGAISTGNASIDKAVILGDLQGSVSGTVANGYIKAGTVLKSAAIGGDLIGGGGALNANIMDSGKIEAQRIGSVTIGGSLYAGKVVGIGTSVDSGTIRAAQDIGKILIKGNVIGTANSPAIISAVGQPTPTATIDVAIKSISVTGRVEFGRILAGYDVNGAPVNADAQIGSITANDWIASDAAAGVQSTNAFFGDDNDALIPEAGQSATIVSRIASIVIRNLIYGSSTAADSYGFVAEQIGSLKIAGVAIPFTSAGGQVFRLGSPSLDVFAREDV